jgi:hypothetical protein
VGEAQGLTFIGMGRTRLALERRCVRLVESSARAIVLLGGTLFLFTGTSKIVDPAEFRRAIIGHALFPAFLVDLVARAFPCIEVAAGLLAIFASLLGPLWVRRAGWMLCLLHFALTLYASWLLLHPPRVPVGCGCGFVLARKNADWSIIAIRNGLAAASLGGLSLAVSARPTSRVERVPTNAVEAS